MTKLLNGLVSFLVIRISQTALAQEDETMGVVAPRVLEESDNYAHGHHEEGRRTRRELDAVRATGEWMYFFFDGAGSEIDTFGFDPAPPFTFEGSVRFDVTDAFLKGDQFEVFDNGKSIGTTSYVPVSGGRVPDPDDAFVDRSFSSASFFLDGGSHSIEIFTKKSPYGGGGAFYRLSCDVYVQFLDTNNPKKPLELMGDTLDLCYYDKVSLTIEAVAPCSDKVTMKLFDERTGKRLVANTETVRPYTLGDDIDATGELLPVEALYKPGKYRIEVGQPGKKNFEQTFEVDYWC